MKLGSAIWKTQLGSKIFQHSHPVDICCRPPPPTSMVSGRYLSSPTSNNKKNQLAFHDIHIWFRTRLQRDFLNEHFFFRFILKRIFGYTLKCSIHIETFFCRSLKVGYVSLSSTPCLCFLLRNLKLIKWCQWGIFYSTDQHESSIFPPQHFWECTFMKYFQM